jgi:hypothetical protein
VNAPFIGQECRSPLFLYDRWPTRLGRCTNKMYKCPEYLCHHLTTRIKILVPEIDILNVDMIFLTTMGSHLPICALHQAPAIEPTHMQCDVTQHVANGSLICWP